ncbi:hypothetical protein B0I35DRAFT_390437 [Stachybotrys elegans]|uniref:Uncharacterized protein n=1 Tax=Stachybotrys elegans TaxID=80388 RepID=A0A8K0WRN3_9HYPO|nr:hypothetical protein B0I35DRAFT_390437 [Stachybotrys elegans]
MNYVHLIEEKPLKKAFVVATLCSTLVGTFTSSIALWERIKSSRKQGARDREQDQEIQKLKAQIEEATKKSGAGLAHDQLGGSFERSGKLISRAFDDGYERLGQRFAIGDTITENKLQAQIISLQQTVINVLQDALVQGRQLDRIDMAKLIAAANAARDNSLDALQQQKQRQMMEAPPPQPPLSPRSSFGPPRRAPTIVSNPSINANGLFCKYSVELQSGRRRPLASSFSPRGDGRCPACNVLLDVGPDDCWGIEKTLRARIREGGRDKDVLEEREFKFGQRLMIKCHMPDGRFACVLCSKLRDRDIVCSTVDALIEHMSRDHDADELECEEDFEISSRLRPLPRALPPI